jgi:hypothetical protein
MKKHILKSIKIKKIIPLAGDSLWMDTRNKKVTISQIDFELIAGEWFYIWVTHNGPWEIYTDSGFEKAITEIVSRRVGERVKIGFTEQGMQEIHYASMETHAKITNKRLAKFFKIKLTPED